MFALLALQLHQLYLPPPLLDYSCSGGSRGGESLYGLAWQRIASGTMITESLTFISPSINMPISTAEMSKTPSEGKVIVKLCYSQSSLRQQGQQSSCRHMLEMKEVELPCSW